MLSLASEKSKRWLGWRTMGKWKGNGGESVSGVCKGWKAKATTATREVVVVVV